MSIGSDLTAARERAGLTVEQVSAATRIRPGLITAMEADDFSRCGGPFYARGHLRSLARALNTDPAPLLARFDESQSTPGVDSGRRDRALPEPPTLHPARPRWAVLVGALLIGLMGWGLIRLLTPEGGSEATAARPSPAPSVTTPAPKPTPGPTTSSPSNGPTKPVVKRLRLTLTALGEGSYVTLRNYDGVRLFQGRLVAHSSHTVSYPGSIRVTLGAADSVSVFINGKRVRPESGRFMITPTGRIATP